MGHEATSSRKLSFDRSKENGLSFSAEIKPSDGVLEETDEANLPNGHDLGDEARMEESSQGCNEIKNRNKEVIDTDNVGLMNGESDHVTNANEKNTTYSGNAKVGEGAHDDVELGGTFENADKSEEGDKDIACVDDVEVVLQNGHGEEDPHEASNTKLDICNETEAMNNASAAESKDRLRDVAVEQDIAMNGPSLSKIADGNLVPAPLSLETALPAINGEFLPTNGAHEKFGEEDFDMIEVNEKIPTITEEENTENDVDNTGQTNNFTPEDEKSNTTAKQQLQENVSGKGKLKTEGDEIVFDELNGSDAKPQDSKTRASGKRKSGKSSKKHEGTCRCYPHHLGQKRTDNCSVM